MGYNQCSLAILGKTRQVIHAEAQLRPTGEKQEFPDAAYVGAALPSGWYVINAEDSANDLVSDQTLALISKGCEAIACSVEEHVMECSAQFWRDGRRIWSVTHDANKRFPHLEAEGELPPAYTLLREEYLAKQAAAGGKKSRVDYIYEVPVELARSFTGFCYDKDTPGLEGDAFEVLEFFGQKRQPPMVAAKKKSFLQRLFGG